MKPSHEKSTKFVRNYRHFDPLLFATDVANIDWSEIEKTVDLNEAVCLFNCEFMRIVNRHMPWKQLRTRIQSAPWVTTEFLSMCYRREYCAKQYKKCPCDDHLLMKLSARRECNQMKKQSQAGLPQANTRKA